MKRYLLFLGLFASVLFIACNSGDKQSEGNNTSDKAIADSLDEAVMHGHNVAMGKMDNIDKAIAGVQSVLDSIAKLPAKAQEGAAALKSRLETLGQDLRSAKDGMDKWMDEYKMDSFEHNLAERIKYLTNENSKVSKVKDDILGGLQRADSILKSKF